MISLAWWVPLASGPSASSSRSSVGSGSTSLRPGSVSGCGCVGGARLRRGVCRQCKAAQKPYGIECVLKAALSHRQDHHWTGQTAPALLTQPHFPFLILADPQCCFLCGVPRRHRRQCVQHSGGCFQLPNFRRRLMCTLLFWLAAMLACPFPGYQWLAGAQWRTQRLFA